MQRNYVELAACPPPYEIHPMPDGMAQIVFYYEPEQLPAQDQDGAERWGARHCALTTRNGLGLAERIEADYGQWLDVAKAAADSEESRKVRSDRDKRLAVCDYTMAADYPASEAERTAWTGYRQALRDIPEQPGFPWDVTWPDKPLKTDYS